MIGFIFGCIRIIKGKIIVIEGTDCSGKETQTSLLVQRLRREGRKIERLSFPDYDTPTGKIVGGPYLGKDRIGEGFFPEGASQGSPEGFLLRCTFHFRLADDFQPSRVNGALCQ